MAGPAQQFLAGCWRAVYVLFLFVFLSVLLFVVLVLQPTTVINNYVFLVITAKMHQQ